MSSPNISPDSTKISVTVEADLEPLIPGYLDNRRRDIAAMEAALAEHDYERLRLIGHGMKGSGGGYGLAQITDLGAAIEAAALRQDNSVLGDQIKKLEAFLDRLEIVFA